MSYEDYGYNALLTIVKPDNNQITEKNNLLMVSDGTIDFDQTTLGTIRTRQGIQSANYIPGISGWKIYGNGAAEFQLIASKGYVKVYSQDTPPTGGTYYQGDLWYDTNDGNKRYVYDGASWVVDEGISGWSQIIDDDGNKPDNNATYGATWNSNISGQPSDASITNPSYITSTKITSTTIESPTITAGTITGSTLQTGTVGPNVNIKSDQIELRNGTSVTGTITGNSGSGYSQIYVNELRTAYITRNSAELTISAPTILYLGGGSYVQLQSDTYISGSFYSNSGTIHGNVVEAVSRLKIPVGTNMYS